MAGLGLFSQCREGGEVSKASVLTSWSLEGQEQRAHGVRFRLLGKLSEDCWYAPQTHSTARILANLLSPCCSGSHPYCLRRQNPLSWQDRLEAFPFGDCLSTLMASVSSYPPRHRLETRDTPKAPSHRPPKFNFQKLTGHLHMCDLFIPLVLALSSPLFPKLAPFSHHFLLPTI